jgi:hypothetical protein
LQGLPAAHPQALFAGWQLQPSFGQLQLAHWQAAGVFVAG